MTNAKILQSISSAHQGTTAPSTNGTSISEEGLQNSHETSIAPASESAYALDTNTDFKNDKSSSPHHALARFISYFYPGFETNDNEHPVHILEMGPSGDADLAKSIGLKVSSRKGDRKNRYYFPVKKAELVRTLRLSDIIPGIDSEPGEGRKILVKRQARSGHDYLVPIEQAIEWKKSAQNLLEQDVWVRNTLHFRPNARGHKADEIISCQALWFESDSLSFEDQWELIRSTEALLGVKALVVKSRRSLHTYFPLEEPLEGAEGVALWVRLMQRLLQLASPGDLDKAMVTPNHSMRLPFARNYAWIDVDRSGVILRELDVPVVQWPQSSVSVEKLEAVLPEWDPELWEKREKSAPNRSAKSGKASSLLPKKARKNFKNDPDFDSWAKEQLPDILEIARYMPYYQERPGEVRYQCQTHDAKSIDHIRVNAATGQITAHCGCDTRDVYWDSVEFASRNGWIAGNKVQSYQEFQKRAKERWQQLNSGRRKTGKKTDADFSGLGRATIKAIYGFNFQARRLAQCAKALGIPFDNPYTLQSLADLARAIKKELSNDKAFKTGSSEYRESRICEEINKVFKAWKKGEKAELAKLFWKQIVAQAKHPAQEYVPWGQRWDRKLHRELKAYNADVGLGKTSQGLSSLALDSYFSGDRVLIVTSLRSLNETTASQYTPITQADIDAGLFPSGFQRDMLELQKKGSEIAWPKVTIVRPETEGADLIHADIIICCPESLRKAATAVGFNIHTVLIDEANAVISRLVRGDLNTSDSETYEDYQALKLTLRTATRIAIGQQDLLKKTLRFVQEHSEITKEQTTLHHHIVKPSSGIDCYRLSEREIYFALSEAVKRREPILLATGVKKQARRYFDALSLQFPKLANRFHIFDAWWDRDFNPNGMQEFLKDPDAFVEREKPLALSISPSMSHGFSLNTNHFQHMLFWGRMEITDESVLQHIARLRACLNGRQSQLKDIGIFLKPCLDPDNPKALNRDHTLVEMIHTRLGRYDQAWTKSLADLSSCREEDAALLEPLADAAGYEAIDRARAWLCDSLMDMQIEEKLGWNVLDSPPDWVPTADEEEEDRPGSLEKDDEIELINAIQEGTYHFDLRISRMAAQAEAKALEAKQEPANMNELLGAIKASLKHQLGDGTNFLEDTQWWHSYYFGVGGSGRYKGLSLEAQLVLKDRKLWEAIKQQRAIRPKLAQQVRAENRLNRELGFKSGSTVLPDVAIAEHLVDRKVWLEAIPEWGQLLKERRFMQDSKLWQIIKNKALEAPHEFYRLFGMRVTIDYELGRFSGKVLKKMGLSQVCTKRAGSDGYRKREYQIVECSQKIKDEFKEFEEESQKKVIPNWKILKRKMLEYCAETADEMVDAIRSQTEWRARRMEAFLTESPDTFYGELLSTEPPE